MDMDLLYIMFIAAITLIISIVLFLITIIYSYITYRKIEEKSKELIFKYDLNITKHA